jgi:hypothetical protein
VQAATDGYNTTVSQAQSIYDATAAQLDSVFAQQQPQAAYDATVAAALSTRTDAYAAAQTAYDAADGPAKQAADALKQTATNTYNTVTLQIDLQYQKDRDTIKSDLRKAAETANDDYNKALKGPAQRFWDFIDNVYNPQMNIATRDNDAGARATLLLRRQQAQKDYQIAVDQAKVTMVQALGDAQVNEQSIIRGCPKRKRGIR